LNERAPQKYQLSVEAEPFVMPDISSYAQNTSISQLSHYIFEGDEDTLVELRDMDNSLIRLLETKQRLEVICICVFGE